MKNQIIVLNENGDDITSSVIVIKGSQENLSAKIVKNFKLKLPKTLDEQKAIANILSKSDKSIKLLEKEIELLREQKKGLMQLLLTGKVRVNEMN
jgi:type I restriction enzyme S subunit